MRPPPKKDETAKSNERNEYIPSFIAKKPFYIDDATQSQSDYLEHQRLQSEKNNDPLATAKWYDRGKKIAPAATKYRKGACENCGAMTHKKKDCLSRPRKTGAKFTGKNIEADEAVQDVQLGWDAKRDRWNGYDAADWSVSGPNLPTGPIKIVGPSGVTVKPGDNNLTGGTAPAVHVS